MSLPLPPPDPDAELPRQPALKIGAIMSVITAMIGAAIVFGADKEQAEAVLGIVAALAAAAPLVSAVWTRRKVWSPASVAELLRRERRR